MGGRSFFIEKAGEEDFFLLCAEGKIRNRKEDRKAAGPAADFLGRTGIRAD